MNVSINSNFLMKNLLTDVTIKSNNRLIKEGKRNIDIIRIVWGDDCEKINSKNNIVG